MSNLIFIKDNDNNVGIGSNMINDIKGNINITQNLNVTGNVNLTNGLIKTTGIGSFGSIHCGVGTFTSIDSGSGSIKTTGIGSFDSITTTTDTGVIFSDGTNSSVYYRNGNILKYGTPTTNSSLELKIRAAGYTASSLNLESECRSGVHTPKINLKAWTEYAGSSSWAGGGGEINIETLAGLDSNTLYRAEGTVNIITGFCCIKGAGERPNVKVGINTTSPLASLHVKIGHQYAVTSGDTNMTRFQWHSANATLAQSIQHGTINDQTYMGAIFEGHVWLPNGHALYVSSDSRIKTNIIDVPDNLALQQLRSIPCRYYEYIDKFLHGKNQTIGFIAQQVKSVLPMAVIEQKEIIPNIHKVINCTWTSVDDKFIMNSSDLLNVSDVKYKFYVSNESDGSDEKEIILTGNSDNTFTFDTQYTNIFCYGSEVEDFHTLDKTKLFTLNFSATQEIDRIQQTHITEIASLKAENTELKTKLNELTNKIKNATTFEDLKNSL